MRATLDTNTLASETIAGPASTIAQIHEAFNAGAFDLVISQHILDELVNTLGNPYFSRRVSTTDSLAFLALLSAKAHTVTIAVSVQGVATHPEDDLVLATAVSANADYLVTGDLKLQALGSFQGVTIVSPRAFLDVLLREDRAP